jgi:lipopolysaccharide biosynthesis glycosyltransferase
MLYNTGELVGGYMSDIHRCFVTFVHSNADDNYVKLNKYLSMSIKLFSEYPLIIFSEKDLETEIIELNTDKKLLYIYKELSIKKVLTEYDEVVFLDSDIVVTHRIDKIWDFFKNVDDITVAPLYRFSNFKIPPTINLNNVILNEENRKLWGMYNLNGVKSNFGENIVICNWHQACCLLSNKKCIPFLNECISNVLDIYSDETALNLLYNKYNFKTFIPSIFMCSYYFGHDILHNNLVLKSEEEYLDFFKTKIFYNYNSDIQSGKNKLELIYNNYNDILFWHGGKNVEIVNKLFFDLISLYLKQKN